jgi:hypothetical protein
VGGRTCATWNKFREISFGRLYTRCVFVHQPLWIIPSFSPVIFLHFVVKFACNLFYSKHGVPFLLATAVYEEEEGVGRGFGLGYASPVCHQADIYFVSDMDHRGL